MGHFLALMDGSGVVVSDAEADEGRGGEGEAVVGFSFLSLLMR